jgi:hypothetical protein
MLSSAFTLKHGEKGYCTIWNREFGANEHIRLQGTINVPDEADLILGAPLVRSQGNINLGLDIDLTISKDGCSAVI